MTFLFHTKQNEKRQFFVEIKDHAKLTLFQAQVPSGTRTFASLLFIHVYTCRCRCIYNVHVCIIYVLCVI